MKNASRRALRALILFSGSWALCAQADSVLAHFTSSTFAGRAAGIAWAHTALISDLPDGASNPATLFTGRNGFRIYTNPVGIALAIQDWDGLYSKGATSLLDEIHRLGMVFKAFCWQSSVLFASVQLSESLPGEPLPERSGRFFPAAGLLDRTYSQAAARIRLAEPVSIGAAAYLVNARGLPVRERSYGGSYGVMIRPHPRLDIGIMYIDVPDQMAPAFRLLNSTIDESVNVGLAFSPRNNLILTLDVRNVSEEENSAKRELHLGGEWRPISWFSMRAGYFALEPEKRSMFCGGFGISLPPDQRGYLQAEESEAPSAFPLSFALHYAIQHDPSEAGFAYTHYLTCAIYL